MYTHRLTAHLLYVATLPCEIRKSQKYVTDFDSILNKLLTLRG